MKKIFLFLLLVVSFTVTAQKTYSIEKPLQLNTVNEGAKSDSVLVRGVDKIVKYVPRSSFSNGSPQNLDQTLANGFSSTRTMYLNINGTEKSATLSGDLLGVMDADTGFGVSMIPAGIHIGQYPHYTTIVRNSDTRGMDSKLIMPEMSAGQTKTIATEELVSTKLTQNSDLVGYPRVYAARGNGTQMMYNVQTVPITTSVGNVNAVPNVQVVKDYVDTNIRPYKSYLAMISSTGSTPLVTVFENTLGAVPVWSRTSAGNYKLTLAGAFSSVKTYLNFQMISADPTFSWTTTMIVLPSDAILLSLIKSGTATDGGGYVEVRVYN